MAGINTDRQKTSTASYYTDWCKTSTAGVYTDRYKAIVRQLQEG